MNGGKIYIKKKIFKNSVWKNSANSVWYMSFTFASSSGSERITVEILYSVLHAGNIKKKKL